MLADELRAFREFKKKYCFTLKELNDVNGILYCDNLPLKDEQGNRIEETDIWVDCAYIFKNSLSKVLSNLFPYRFMFRGEELNSIECFFQGIKFKDNDIQKLVFEYSGKDAYHLKATSDYDWRKTGLLYWQGEPINRFSADYENIVDELYVSAAQNPFYRQALIKTNKYILHSIGGTNPNETVLTRFEFEKEINTLSAFLKSL